MTSMWTKRGRAVALVSVAAASVIGTSAAIQAQAPGKTVWSGVYTAAQATRGKAAYATNCASCHGAALGGGDSAPPLTGSGFLGNWNGNSTGDLFTRIHDTMPASDPGSLPPATSADIEAYVLQANGFPAGSAALPADAQTMADTKIIGTRPAS